MQILLNGQPREFAADTTLATLLELTGYADRRVAIEINRDIAPRSRFAEILLKDGDKVEIVHAIGGG
ncbi:MAG: sulfur carrier protein ThiS [Tahibacter sp.]